MSAPAIQKRSYPQFRSDEPSRLILERRQTLDDSLAPAVAIKAVVGQIVERFPGYSEQDILNKLQGSSRESGESFYACIEALKEKLFEEEQKKREVERCQSPINVSTSSPIISGIVDRLRGAQTEEGAREVISGALEGFRQALEAARGQRAKKLEAQNKVLMEAFTLQKRLIVEKEQEKEKWKGECERTLQEVEHLKKMNMSLTVYLRNLETANDQLDMGRGIF